MHFDDFLGIIGEFGRFQKRIYFLLCLASVIAGFHGVMVVFVLGTPEHRCKLPDYPGDTYAVQSEYHRQLINQSIPMSTGTDGDLEYDECDLFKNGTNEKVACDSWVYDQTIFKATFTSEKNLVCDKALLTSTGSMMFFLGLLVGAFTLGNVSDWIGRKKTLCFGLSLLLASSMALAFSPDFYSFCVLRFLVGFSAAGNFMSGFVIGMEIVAPSKRIWTGILIEYAFAVGLVILAGLGYAIRHWKYIAIACSAPTILFMLFWWFIPESPRWLINKGRKEEAKVILRRMAKENKVEITEKQLDEIESDETPNKGKLYQLFTIRVLLIRTLIIIFNWIVVSMAYYGLSLNSGNLSGNFYLNFFLSGVVEFPAYTLCIVFMDRIGRKILHASSMILGGLSCICTIFTIIYLDKSLQSITVTLAMIGKVGAAAGFAVIYVWSAELYPTSVRHASMGLSSSLARIGAMSSPYIADLSKVIDGHLGQALPLAVFGGLAVLAGALSLYLPETLNQRLPETIEDGLKLGKKERKYEENGVPLDNKGFKSEETIQTQL